MGFWFFEAGSNNLSKRLNQLDQHFLSDTLMASGNYFQGSDFIILQQKIFPLKHQKH